MKIQTWRFSYLPWLLIIVSWALLAIAIGVWWIALFGLASFLCGRVTGIEEFARIVLARELKGKTND